MNCVECGKLLDADGICQNTEVCKSTNFYKQHGMTWNEMAAKNGWTDDGEDCSCLL